MGIYSRDVNLSDVDGQSMTHMNYSFDEGGWVDQLFDEFAACRNAWPIRSPHLQPSDYDAMPELRDMRIRALRHHQNGDTITVTSVPVGWNVLAPTTATLSSCVASSQPGGQPRLSLGGWAG